MTETAVAQPQATSPSAFVLPFINSVRDVFKTMLRVQTTFAKPYLKQENRPAYDVSTIIGFSGEVIGSVLVSFQTDAALKLVAAFVGSPVAQDSPDFADAVGELANMIAGGAKKSLKAVASISVPNVIIGAGHTVARLSDIPCVVIPCSTPAGEFTVEVCIKHLKQAGAALQ